MAMKFNIEFKLNKSTEAIIREKIINESNLTFMAEHWHGLYAKYQPKDLGNLGNDVTYSTEGNKGIITHTVPYAHYQYEGRNFNFNTDHNPLATHHWDEAAKASGEGEKLARAMEKKINEG